MKRIPLIPVLLLVLTLLCTPALHQSAAWAGDADDSMRTPDDGWRTEDMILDPTGSPDDDADGDPDTAGDGFGYTSDHNLLGGRAARQGPHDKVLAELMLFLVDQFLILR